MNEKNNNISNFEFSFVYKENSFFCIKKVCKPRKCLIYTLNCGERALKPTYSRNIIKLQITDNHTQFGIHSKSKSF